MSETSGEHARLGLGAVSAAVTLMGIGSVVAKAAEIDGPVLGFHRAWGAAVVYGLLLLATRGTVTRGKLRSGRSRRLDLRRPAGLLLLVDSTHDRR